MIELLKDIFRPIYRIVVSQDEREYRRLQWKYVGVGRFRLKKDVAFLSYKIDVPDLPSFLGQFKEIFVEKAYWFKSTSENLVIIDCGSNIGMSLLFFSRNFPNARIIGYEADPEIAKLCGTNLIKNNVHNCKLYNSAVWIDSLGVNFSVEGADGGSVSGVSNVSVVSSIRLREVLDGELNVDLLKMDIEGAEHSVLMDCADVLHKVNNLFVEFHSIKGESQNLGDILKLLENNKFRYYIEGIDKRKSPLMRSSANGTSMDLQLNIYAWKN